MKKSPEGLYIYGWDRGRSVKRVEECIPGPEGKLTERRSDVLATKYY